VNKIGHSALTLPKMKKKTNRN